MLSVERKVREETENVMFRMLEDINNKLQNEISVINMGIYLMRIG